MTNKEVINLHIEMIDMSKEVQDLADRIRDPEGRIVRFILSQDETVAHSDLVLTAIKLSGLVDRLKQQVCNNVNFDYDANGELVDKRVSNCNGNCSGRDCPDLDGYKSL